MLDVMALSEEMKVVQMRLMPHGDGVLKVTVILAQVVCFMTQLDL